MRDRLRSLFDVSARNPELLVAQAQAFTRQVPLLYALLLVNMSALALTHLASAPLILTVYAPLVFMAVCLARLAIWWRRRNLTIDPHAAARMLRNTTIIAAALGIFFVTWSLSLYPYGGPYERAQVTLFIAITTIGCMFCLMHFKPAALVLVGCVLVPAAIFLATRENGVMAAIALNLLLALVVLLILLLKNTRDFEDLVASRQVLARRQLEAQAHAEESDRHARLDHLTQLPNRLGFLESLGATLRASATSGERFLVGIVDLDGFKAVNDVYGHAVGDKVLVDTGRRLTQIIGGIGIVGRLGGDEFAIVIPEDLPQCKLDRISDALSALLQHPFSYEEATARLSASVGFAYSRPEDTLDQLQDRADYATYRAKHENPGSVVLFSDAHEDQIRQQRVLEQALRKADLESEISAVFQPIHDMRVGRTVGYEVLCRWNNPECGDVPPSLFIPIAERLGLVAQIDLIMVRRALDALQLLPDPIRLSVNLSAQEIGSDAAIKHISAELGASRRLARRIDFEITETAVMRDVDQAIGSLFHLMAHGARVSLDDFGTGHSSLSYVHRLPIHRLKVDRSFVTNITEPTSLAVVKTTLDLCRNLQIECVVEGIETTEQTEILVGLGAHLLQGYHFGRPMPLATVVAGAVDGPRVAELA